MVAAEEVVGPGGDLIERPVSRRSITFLQRFLLPIGLESVVSPHIDALLLSGKDLTPSLHGTSTLSIEEILGALRLRTKKGDLKKSAVSASAAPGGDKLDPVFQFGNRSLERCAVDLPEKPLGRFVKRGLGREGQMMEKSHEHVTSGFAGMPSFMGRVVRVQTCLPILFKNVETFFLWEGEFMDIGFPIWREFL
jgi:hypothetical protein